MTDYKSKLGYHDRIRVSGDQDRNETRAFTLAAGVVVAVALPL
jgi:hypothetical protein